MDSLQLKIQFNLRDCCWIDVYEHYHLSDAFDFSGNNIIIHEWIRVNDHTLKNDSCKLSIFDYLNDWTCVIFPNLIGLYDNPNTIPHEPRLLFSNTPENMNDIKKVMQLKTT